MERPDKKAGFVSFSDWRAVTHFARYYLNVGDEAVITRRWYAGRISGARMRALARRYGLAVGGDQRASASVRTETLAWPSLVEMVIDLPATVEEYRKSLPRSAISDLNRILRHGLSMKVSHDTSRLKEFHRLHFLPSVTGRHGSDAYVISWDQFRQFYSEGRDCELIEVWCAGVWVGGLVSETDETGVRFRRLGWLNGDSTHHRKGLVGVLYWFAIKRAIEHGKEQIVLGGGAPYLEDGLFHAKGKWRARLSCERSGYAVWRVMIDSTHEDCRAFFARYSLLMKSNETGQFKVLSGRPPHDVRQASAQSEQIIEWQRLDELPNA